MILAIACWMSGFMPGNQFPYADQRLYAKSMPIMTPVGDGYMLIESETYEVGEGQHIAAKSGDKKATYVVQEFGTSVSLNIVRVEITPSELDIYPELVAGGTLQNILGLQKK